MFQGNGETKQREEQRRKNCKPTDTLFVVNFDPGTTHERDLEKHFSSYGRLKRVQVKKNYGFVQYESLDDAIAARNGLSLSRLLGMPLTQLHACKYCCCSLCCHQSFAVAHATGATFIEQCKAPWCCFVMLDATIQCKLLQLVTLSCRQNPYCRICGTRPRWQSYGGAQRTSKQSR